MRARGGSLQTHSGVHRIPTSRKIAGSRHNNAKIVAFLGHTASYGICSRTPILAVAYPLHKRGGICQIWRSHVAQYKMPIAASMGHMEGAGVQVRSSSC